MPLTRSEQVAQSTVKIVSGMSTGSGFYYKTRDIVVTNGHVVAALGLGSQARVVNYWNHQTTGTVVAFSPADENDYALIRLDQPPSDEVQPLTPTAEPYLQRGTELVFSGHPFGYDQTIVSHGWIAGPLSPQGYFVSGNINKGNSGGPAVLTETGNVIGLATSRPFPGGPELDLMEGILTPAIS